MMSAKIHFEVFFKKNKKAAWALVDARDDKAAAIKIAEGLLAENKDGSARVSRETLRDNNTFGSLTVFSGGLESFQEIKEKDREASLPCSTPDDLAKPHARDTMRRALGGWMERKSILPMELLHRPDLVENLEAAGTELQHAVQKVAVASARDQGADVQVLVKQLNELVQRSLTRVYKDDREGRLKTYPKGKGFAEVAQSIHDSDPRAYALRATIADRLRTTKNYGDKLETLLDLSDDLPADEKAREFARAETDQYLADVISFEGGRDALLGQCNDLGETVIRLTCLFDGDHDADAIKMAPRSARRAAGKIGDGMLDASRAIIAQNLLKELERPKRLKPKSVREEVRLLRELARKLVMSPDALLPTDQLIKAFSMRSGRLLQPETIDEYLRFSQDANEDVTRLLDLEENLVGEHNKQKLAGYVRATLGANKTEQFFIRGELKPLESLSLLTAHQSRVLKGSYPAKEKADLSHCLDQLGLKILDHSKVLHAVEAGQRPALDTAEALLKLATAGALPLGDCSADAQARALRKIKSETGLREAQAADARDKLRQIQVMLEQLAQRSNAA